MKKLYRKGGTVHPSPSSDHFLSLSFLPTAIISLGSALSPADKQVLAYLLSCSTADKKHPTDNNNNNNNNRSRPHQASSTCYCFTCYTSYWSRWDSSPNRQLIHEIIDAFEDYLISHKNNNHSSNNNRQVASNNNNRRHKKKNQHGIVSNDGNDDVVGTEPGRVEPVEDNGRFGGGDEGENKPGSVRKMVSFLWGTVWGSN
ncbi:hypothetical protein vseg_017359 [Gypsophila vaccaria]